MLISKKLMLSLSDLNASFIWSLKLFSFLMKFSGFSLYHESIWRIHHVNTYYKYQMFTINDSHQSYDNRQSFLSTWTVFCPFTLPPPFYISVPKIVIRWCMAPDICCTTDRQTGGWTDGRTDTQTDRKSDI